MNYVPHFNILTTFYPSEKDFLIGLDKLILNSKINPFFPFTKINLDIYIINNELIGNVIKEKINTLWLNKDSPNNIKSKIIEIFKKNNLNGKILLHRGNIRNLLQHKSDRSNLTDIGLDEETSKLINQEFDRKSKIPRSFGF